MSENENQQSTIASNLCVNGCGFYGSTQFDGMCSVCYKENVRKRQKQEDEQIQSGQHSAALCSSASSSALALGRESLLDAGAAAPAAPLLAGGGTTVPVAGASDAESASSTDRGDASGAESGQRKRNRCGVCKKKVGLTGFECRCGGVFCCAHRYSDKHSCGFDYQSLGQEQIRKANPQVVSSKVDKL